MTDKLLLNRTATTLNLLPSEIAEVVTVNQFKEFKGIIDRHITSGALGRFDYGF